MIYCVLLANLTTLKGVLHRQRRCRVLQPAAVEWLVWIHSTNKFVRNFQQIMQNEPNFPRFSPENDDFTKKRTQFEPNTNPNEPNFGPKIDVNCQNEPNYEQLQL